MAKDKYINNVGYTESVNQWDGWLSFFGLPTKDEPYPEYVGAYSGDSFDNTNTLGGYGQVTSNTYN